MIDISGATAASVTRFGAWRYCCPLKDVLGQIHTSKMPVLADKAEGSSSPNTGYFQPVCLLLPEAEELAWCFSG